MIVKKFELNTFLDLLKNQEVEAFLQRDRCCVSIDNYLLAAAFVFFKRANLTMEEFTVRNLWLALYLALYLAPLFIAPSNVSFLV